MCIIRSLNLSKRDNWTIKVMLVEIKKRIYHLLHLFVQLT